MSVSVCMSSASPPFQKSKIIQKKRIYHYGLLRVFTLF